MFLKTLTKCPELQKPHSVAITFTYICLGGEAVIKGENYEKKIKTGDYFYLPYIAEGKFTVSTDSKAEIIECLPSKQDK